jgi:hypothetical protein
MTLLASESLQGRISLPRLVRVRLGAVPAGE